jgi:hypothetical protein
VGRHRMRSAVSRLTRRIVDALSARGHTPDSIRGLLTASRFANLDDAVRPDLRTAATVDNRERARARERERERERVNSGRQEGPREHPRVRTDLRLKSPSVSARRQPARQASPTRVSLPSLVA